MKKALSYLSCLFILLATACSKGKKDDDNPGGGGVVTITSFSPEYTLWGDNVEINGTGFSTNKSENYVWFFGDGNCGSSYSDSSGWRKAEVVTASATKLVVKAPWTIDNGIPCGHSSATVKISVNGKYGVSAMAAKFMGFAVPVGFCYWYGGAYYAPGAVRVGDSAMLELGGHSIGNLLNSGNVSKLRLSVDGAPVPIKYRPGVSGCDSRAVTFLLDADEFGDPSKCEPKDAQWGGTGKKRNFKLFIENQPQSEVSKEYWVFSLPKPVFTGATGPTSWSKSAGGTPEWTVTGRNMFYNKVRFTAQAPCTGFVEATTTCTYEFCEQFKFGIPLSLLSSGCNYTVSLVDVCGAFKVVGTVTINP